MKDSLFSKKKQRKFIKKTVKPVDASPEKSASEFTLHFPKITFPKLKHYERDFALLLIPLSLFLVFLILNFVNDTYTKEIAANQLVAFPMDTQINPYPFAQEMPLLPLSAKSAIITDANSQVVIFAKNALLRFSMASTVKIMTALTALDYYKDNSVLTIKSSGVEGTVLGLPLGDKFYFKDLLYAMLLPSANDAATAIADNYPGGATAFVAKMNQKAAALHLFDMHFADPTGLEDDGDYTTATDMARLASIAIQNKEFARVTGTKQKVITNVSKSHEYALTNLNKLLGENGVTGIKTGTTAGAGEVLVTSSVAAGHIFIIVVMNSQDRFADTGVLLNFIAQKVQFISPEGMR